MIRLLGGLLGAALAIALLLLLVGIPQFRVPSVDLDNAIVTLPLRTTPVEPVEASAETRGPAEAPPAVLPPASIDERAQTAQIAVTEIPPETDAFTAPPLAAGSVEAPPDAADGTAAAPPPVPGWYTFWSPFRSEIAARGFVARLQSVTSLDYRIDKLEAGVYQVAFAYQDDAEIAARLAEITSATGLELASR